MNTFANFPQIWPRLNLGCGPALPSCALPTYLLPPRRVAFLLKRSLCRDSIPEKLLLFSRRRSIISCARSGTVKVHPQSRKTAGLKSGIEVLGQTGTNHAGECTTSTCHGLLHLHPCYAIPRDPLHNPHQSPRCNKSYPMEMTRGRNLAPSMPSQRLECLV